MSTQQVKKTVLPHTQLAQLKQQLSKAQQERERIQQQALLAKAEADANAKNVSDTPEDDMALFNMAVKGVTKLKQTTATAFIPTNKPKRKPSEDALFKRAAASGTEGASISGISDTQALLNPVSGEQILSYRQQTLQIRVFDQLKAGELRWFQAVDLHSCTVEQAREAVLAIIQSAQKDNQNVLKIVHGKGQHATLKTYVNAWLRQHPAVLGFCSAPTQQGGTGAVLVLIKKTKDQL